MPEGTPGGSSDQTFGPAGGQPGVTPEDLGQDPPHVDASDVTVVDADEVVAPPAGGDEPVPRVNADLVDDPEEVARTIEDATGEQVDIVREDDIT